MKTSRRIIARLDMKQEWVIKGIQMEGWRKVGDPQDIAKEYFLQGADELVYMDVVASLYERNNLSNIIEEAAKKVFVPITVGGGIRNLEAVKQQLAVGADKVAINTGATVDPSLISKISDTYGSQATVVSIEAKKLSNGSWEALTDNGRNHTHLDAIEWAAKVAGLGAGELLVTSVDLDGTGRGLDLDLIEQICNKVDIPVIACGGVGSVAHCVEAFDRVPRLSGIAIAHALHNKKFTIADVRAACIKAGHNLREFSAEGL